MIKHLVELGFRIFVLAGIVYMVSKGYTDFSCENHKDSFIINNEAHNICILLEKMNCIDDILIKLGYPINKKYRVASSHTPLHP